LPAPLPPQVALSTFLSIPIMLHVFDLQADGWTWVHAALFCAMVASTDAVAGVGGWGWVGASQAP